MEGCCGELLEGGLCSGTCSEAGLWCCCAVEEEGEGRAELL